MSKSGQATERNTSMPGTEQECLILRIVPILQASECHILCAQKEFIYIHFIVDHQGKKVMV